MSFETFDTDTLSEAILRLVKRVGIDAKIGIYHTYCANDLIIDVDCKTKCDIDKAVDDSWEKNHA